MNYKMEKIQNTNDYSDQQAQLKLLNWSNIYKVNRLFVLPLKRIA